MKTTSNSKKKKLKSEIATPPPGGSEEAEVKVKAPNPSRLFDIVDSINAGVRLELTPEEYANPKIYEPYKINRYYSFFRDTYTWANIANSMEELTPQQHYNYYMGAIKKRKRYYGKWPKEEKVEELQLIMKCFNFSKEKSRWALRLLSEEQLKALKQTQETGGVK